MKKALAILSLVMVTWFGFSVFFAIVMIDGPAFIRPVPDSDVRARFSPAGTVTHFVLFIACAVLGRWLYRYVNRARA